MKIKTPSILSFMLFLGITISSCKRDTADSPNNNPARPENFAFLNAPSSFDWETNKSVLISLSAFSTSVSNERGVITIFDENDNVLYIGMHSPQINFKQEILVP